MITQAEAQRIATAWLASPESARQHDGKRAAVAAAVAWLKAHGPDLEAALQPLMTGLLTDGMYIGAFSARAVTTGTTVAKAAGVKAGPWKPGNTAQAGSFLDKLGFSGPDPAYTRDATGKLADGVLGAFGRVLAEGMQASADAKSLAESLAAAAADSAKAMAAVLDQITRQAALAASYWYHDAGVEYVEWLTEDDDRVCVICQANEDAGPVRLGDEFPSGDTEPEAHPRCRCALIPAAAWRIPQEPQAPVQPEPEPEAPGQRPPFDPLEFATAADAQKWLADHTPDLDEAQREAVDWYTGPGAYEANAPLRRGEQLPADVAAQVRALDSAMGPLPADLVLSRMVDVDAFPGVSDLTSLAGSEISDQAFISTSLGPPTRDAGTDVQLHIAAPKGTPAVITGKASRLPKQREVILARGTRFAVTRAEQGDDGRWELWLTVVPQDTASVAKAQAAATGDGAGKSRWSDSLFTVTGTAPRLAMTMTQAGNGD